MAARARARAFSFRDSIQHFTTPPPVLGRGPLSATCSASTLGLLFASTYTLVIKSTTAQSMACRLAALPILWALSSAVSAELLLSPGWQTKPAVNCTSCYATLVVSGGVAPTVTVWVTKAGDVYLPLNKTAPAVLPPAGSLRGVPNVASYRTSTHSPRVTAFDLVRLVIDPMSGAVAIDTTDVVYTRTLLYDQGGVSYTGPLPPPGVQGIPRPFGAAAGCYGFGGAPGEISTEQFGSKSTEPAVDTCGLLFYLRLSRCPL